MAATLLFRKKGTNDEGDILDLVIWSVPTSAQYPEGVRYRMAFIPHGAARPAVLYDNHHPKGHHKHWEGREEPYGFSDVHQLRLDFERDIVRWKKTRRRP